MAKGIKGSRNQFCPHGHNRLIGGISADGHCMECRRKQQNKYYWDNAEILRPIRRENKRLERELFKRLFGKTTKPKEQAV
jgi:hypothetical protein